MIVYYEINIIEIMLKVQNKQKYYSLKQSSNNFNKP